MPAFPASNENKAASAEYKRLPTFCSLPSHSTPSLQTSPNQTASIKNSRIFIYQRKCPTTIAAILRQKCADNPWKCAKKTHISTTYRHISSLSLLSAWQKNGLWHLTKRYHSLLWVAIHLGAPQWRQVVAG